MSPQGIQLRRTKGWRMPAGAVSVARPSRWGNPWMVGQTVEVSFAGDGMRGGAAGHYDGADPRFFAVSFTRGLSAAEAVLLYRDDLVRVLEDDDPYYDDVREALAELRGKDLACWCALDQPCHRNVLLELANGART